MIDTINKSKWFRTICLGLVGLSLLFMTIDKPIQLEYTDVGQGLANLMEYEGTKDLFLKSSRDYYRSIGNRYKEDYDVNNVEELDELGYSQPYFTTYRFYRMYYYEVIKQNKQLVRYGIKSMVTSILLVMVSITMVAISILHSMVLMDLWSLIENSKTCVKDEYAKTRNQRFGHTSRKAK